MCFSAQASFAAGALLIPAGSYCIYSAIRKQPQYLPLAVVPVFFGIQQIAEGFVWQGILHDPPKDVRTPSLVFLFFALAFWPFWFPFLTYWTETDTRKRKFFLSLSMLTTSWFWILYYPLLRGAISLTIEIKHHSILYEYSSLPIYDYLPKTPLRVVYLLCIAVPMALGTESLGRIPGLFLGLSAVAAFLLFEYAFVSVWCFFAAIMAIYLCWVFYALPEPTSRNGPI